MSLEQEVDFWLARLNARNNLDHTARVILALGKINHSGTVAHMQRVALMCRFVAAKLGIDQRAAFFGGLLHDFGKFLLPAGLLAENNTPPIKRKLTADEMELIRTHAKNGFVALSELHGFTALCAGLHHAVYEHGYGITDDDFPTNWPPTLKETVKKFAVIISICDYIDAKISRSEDKTLDVSVLQIELAGKFPDQEKIISAALAAAEVLKNSSP